MHTKFHFCSHYKPVKSAKDSLHVVPQRSSGFSIPLSLRVLCFHSNKVHRQRVTVRACGGLGGLRMLWLLSAFFPTERHLVTLRHRGVSEWSSKEPSSIIKKDCRESSLLQILLCLQIALNDAPQRKEHHWHNPGDSNLFIFLILIKKLFLSFLSGG